MNIKLYRQRKFDKPNGRIIFQGEDTHPYADDRLIIVADGLGGRGGFPHTKIDKRIFEREELYDLMFEPIFPREVDEDFKTFVTENFEELFITKDYYYSEEIEYVERYDAKERGFVKVGKPTYPYIRCSGYFASRIVTAIALYELKYNPAFNRDTVFAAIAEMSAEEQDAYAMELGKRLAASIAEKLPIVANEVGFTIEMDSNNKGVYLLPSTLTLTLYNERENDVQALYLWAGDTRGYVWDEENGIAQVTEDHEQDETMTNLITLSKPFGIEGRFLTFPKPCVLFNTSDGVYKPKVFANGIDMEAQIFQSFGHFEKLDDALGHLVAAFNHISADDSSTMSLVAFGYNDYDEFRAAVKRRLGRISDRFLSRLPDLFETDYPTELENLDNSILRMPALKEELIKLEGVRDVVRQEMLIRGYAPLNEAKRAMGADVVRLEEEKRAAERAITEWVEANWVADLRLRRISSARTPEGERSPFEMIEALKAEARGLIHDHHAEMIAVADDYRASTTVLAGILREVSNNFECAGNPSTYADYDGAREMLLSVIKAIDSVRCGESVSVRRYNEIRVDMDHIAEDCIERERDAIAELVARILAADDPADLSISGSTCEKLKPLHAAYKAAEKALDACPVADADALVDGFIDRYWNESGRLLGLIWNNHRHLIPDELLDRLLADDPERLAKRRKLVEGNTIRNELYALYDSTYYRFYRESRL